MVSPPQSLRLLELLRRYHFNARYLGSNYPQGLSGIEEAVLVTMASAPGARAADIVAALRVDKSTVSRALLSLEQGKYIAVSIDRADKRVRHLTIAQRGFTYIGEHRQFHQRLAAAFSSHLSTEQLRRLQDYLTRFADGDEAPPISPQEGESPLIVQMRRLGRAHSILGNSYLGSEFSIAEWLVMCAVRELPAPVQPTILHRLLGIPKNTLSQMLARLRSRKFLSTKALPHDKRMVEIVLRSAGSAALKQVEAIATERFSRALLGFSPNELEDFLAIFSLYIGEYQESEHEQLVLQEDRVARKLFDATEVQTARGVHLMHLVCANHHWHAPATIFAEGSDIFGLFEGEKLRAVCEIEKKLQLPRIVNLSAAIGDDTSILDLVCAVIRLEQGIRSAKTFEIEQSPFTAFLDERFQRSKGSIRVDVTTRPLLLARSASLNRK